MIDEFDYMSELGDVEDYPDYPDSDDDLDDQQSNDSFLDPEALEQEVSAYEQDFREAAALNNPTLKDSCFQMVLSIFPDIHLDFLEEVAAARDFNAEGVINYILGEEENGTTYPRKPRLANRLKRKRSSTDNFEHIIQKRERLTEEEMTAIQKRFETPAGETAPRSAKYRTKV
jgi:hypothetical protein